MESNSNEFISKIIYNSVGIFDKFLYFPISIFLMM